MFSARNRNCFLLSHGTSCGSAGDSLARAACRAVATCREEEARREAVLGRAVHTGLVRLGGHARGTPRDLAAGEAARLVAPQHVAIRWMAPRLSQQRSLRSRSGHTTSHHEICGSGWWTTRCCATCRDGTPG